MGANMAGHSIQEIHIDKLLFDVRNPRHDILDSQNQTLREIVLDQKSKLTKLAHDIVDHGMNPSELTIVVPSEDNIGKFTILEGNRRLAALKLLDDPTIAVWGASSKAIDALKSFSKTYNANPIQTLGCVVFDRREDANHWIELRHTGENEGRGVVGWRAKEKARFNERLGKRSPALQIVEFVRKNANLSEAERETLKKPNISSIQRLVNDPDVREPLGIDISDGYLTTNLASEEVISGLTKVVMDVSTQRISVDDIRHKSDRRDYISEFTEEDLPDTNATPVGTWKLESQTSPVTPRVSSSTKGAGTVPVTRSVPLSTSRKTLIPSSCVLRIKQPPRINKIYRELRALEIDLFENSGAVMFRVFLELSLEEYARKNQIPVKDSESLVNKLKKVADHLKNAKSMTANELKPIRVACSSKDALFATNTLNAYVHNPDFAPKPIDLKVTWDNFEKFFKAMWS